MARQKVVRFVGEKNIGLCVCSVFFIIYIRTEPLNQNQFTEQSVKLTNINSSLKVGEKH